jgi:hypothetical protein
MQAAGAGGSFNLTWLLQEMELPGADALSKLEGFNREHSSGPGWGRGQGLGWGWAGAGQGRAGQQRLGRARGLQPVGQAGGGDFCRRPAGMPYMGSTVGPYPPAFTLCPTHPSHPPAPLILQWWTSIATSAAPSQRKWARPCSEPSGWPSRCATPQRWAGGWGRRGPGGWGLRGGGRGAW